MELEVIILFFGGVFLYLEDVTHVVECAALAMASWLTR